MADGIELTPSASASSATPSGSAGGDLTGTYPNPTIKSAVALTGNATAVTQSASDNSTKIATTAYVDTLGALKANLASPTFTGTPVLPTGTTATTQSAADSTTKLATTAFVTTADNLKADLASPTFTGTPTLPTGTVATTQALSDSSTKLATTAYANSLVNASSFRFAPHSYCTTTMPQMATSNIASGGVNAGRSTRVMMAETGVLHDVSVLIQTSSGNSNILIFDTGQANGTHTTRTVLGAKGSTATPAGNAWLTYDPSLSVTAGDTLEFMWAADNTSAKVYCFNAAATGAGTLPTSSFAPSSGAGTTNQVLGANVTAVFALTAGGTIASGSWTASDAIIMFVWRIASS